MDGGIAVITADVVSDAQTQRAASTSSSSSAVRFGLEGVLGLQGGELQMVRVGDLETKDAGRWEVPCVPSSHRFSSHVPI
jgi:hypothetical protein